MSIVITGLGMLTPLGANPAAVLRRIQAGDSAAAPPANFDASPFVCPVCAQITDFQPQRYLAEPKMLRFMSRDAQLAVAAARLALEDAALRVGHDYQPEDVALFGASGLAGLPLSEVLPLAKASVGADHTIELDRFGRAGLRAISPLLSFKILGNMPVCFVSICENIQGPNGIYTPWEGQGAQAIEAGMRAIESGQARCALVGGCDVKTHELAFLSLEQQGALSSWQQRKKGPIPGEGAVFLVLEDENAASARGAKKYARVKAASFVSHRQGTVLSETYIKVLRRLDLSSIGHLVGAYDGDASVRMDEDAALASLGIKIQSAIYPKEHTGNLFAAAAALQVGLGAVLAGQGGAYVLAHCFGHGSEQAAFMLEPLGAVGRAVLSTPPAFSLSPSDGERAGVRGSA